CPPLNAAKVGKLFTLANFLDSGNFSASTITKLMFSFSPANFLNFGFIIRQFPHHEAEYCTITVSLLATTSCKMSFSNSCNIVSFFDKEEVEEIPPLAKMY